MNLQDLKKKKPPELLAFAEEQGVEGAAMMRRQELMFAILQRVAAADQAIFGVGTIEVLPDGFGYLRSMEASYLPGADDIYISPTQVRKFGLRTGDTVEGEIRAPKDGERYFAMVQINTVNFEDPEALRHRINFDSLTPLYPDEKLKLEIITGAAGLHRLIKEGTINRPSLALTGFFKYFANKRIQVLGAAEMRPALDLVHAFVAASHIIEVGL